MGLKDTSRTILVVDDEPDIASIAKEAFEDEGWMVHMAHSVADAKTLLGKHPCDAILSDFAMMGENGIDLLRWVRAQLGDRLVFVLLTGGYDLRARDATKFGANAIFQKPCDWPRLINAVTIAVTLHSLRK